MTGEGVRFPDDYEYIERTYGIRPRYGERVREGDMVGVVKRERKGHSHHVAVQFAGSRYTSFCHPRDLVYLDREGKG